MAGVARPVRIVANSSLANSTARSIFSSASKSVSSITCSVASFRRRRDWLFGGDQRADLLTAHRADDRVLTLGTEDQHGQLVVPAQAQRGRVDHPQPFAQRLLEGELVQLHRVRVGPEIGRVQPVHPVLAHQYDGRVDLQRPLGGHRVGGEVRHPGARAEDHYPALLQVPDRLARNVRLGHLGHRDRALYPGVDPGPLQEVLEGEAVHHGGDHAHVVRAGPVHPALLQLGAAEEVAAADHHGHLDTQPYHVGDLPGQLLYDIGVHADRAAAEHLTGQLEDHAPGASAAHTIGYRPDHAASRIRRYQSVTFPFVGGGPVARIRERGGADLSATSPYAVGLRLPHFEPDEPAHRDPGFLEDLRDGLLLVLYRSLFDQDEVLEEAADPTLDDLWQGGIGLALLAGGLLGDPPLGGDHVLGYLVAAQVLRPHRGHLHGHAPGVRVAGLVRLARILHQDADRRRQVSALAVQVHRDRRPAVEDREPVDHDLLADLRGELLHDLPDGTPGGQLGVQQRVEVGRRGTGDVVDQGLGQPDELGVLGHEVGLAVELQQSPTGVRDQAVGRGTPGPLADVLGPLDAQDLDGLVEVATRFLQRLLTVHHPGAGQFAELLDVRGSEVRHASLSSCGWRAGGGYRPRKGRIFSGVGGAGLRLAALQPLAPPLGQRPRCR